MIGLCGAHRTGKTSLARAYAEKHDLEFVETSASAVFWEMGLDPAKQYDFDTRLTVQEEILRRFDQDYSRHSRGDMTITDRTPLDMLAYTLADAVQDSVSEAQQARLARYTENCFSLTNRRFMALIVVQPGIPVVSEPGKAAINQAYIEHLNSIILGLSVDERILPAHFYLPRRMTDMNERIEAVDFAVGRTRKRAEVESMGASIH